MRRKALCQEGARSEEYIEGGGSDQVQGEGGMEDIGTGPSHRDGQM